MDVTRARQAPHGLWRLTRRRSRCGVATLLCFSVLLCFRARAFLEVEALSTFVHDHQRLRKVLLLTCFILVDTGQAFISDWAERRTDPADAKHGNRYVRQSLLVFEAALAIGFGLGMQWATSGLAGIRLCFNWSKFLEFLPNCICFSVGISLKMRALRYYNAGTIKIFGQLRMPMLAILSTLWLQHHYSFAKWQAIGILTVSCFAYMHLKEQGRGHNQLRCSRELCLLLGWVLLNSCGGVLAERAYKTGDLPFFAKFVSEDFSYFLIHAILLIVMAIFDPSENFCDREQRPGGFFDGWDRRTLALALMLLLDATVGNLLLQEFSALTKCITKAFCVAMVYFVSLTYSRDAVSASSALPWLALLVIQASLMYSTL